MHGKWLAFVWVCALQAYPELVLRVVDQHGDTQTVQQGEPFGVTVTVMGEDETGEPRIEHREKCAVFERQPTIKSVVVVNGQRSAYKKYTYTARIDGLGTYALGPAVLEIGQQRIQSNAVVVQVVKPTPAAVPTDGRPYARASLEKTSVYVGEQVLLTVDIAGQSVKRVELPSVTLSHFNVQPFGAAVAEPVAEGQRVSYRFLVCPHMSGALLIPRITALCQVEREDSSFFARFFGEVTQTVPVHTTPLELTVKPLPGTQAVDGVGSHLTFKLQIDQTQLSARTGATVTAQLTGVADLSSALQKPLQGIPAALLVYDAGERISVDQRRVTTKKHEWVVQGVQPGVYTIPAQTLTFFDPVRAGYTTLRSQPLTITVAAEPKPGIVPVFKQVQRVVACHWPALAPWIFVTLALLAMLTVLGGYAWQHYRARIPYSYARWRRAVKGACRRRDAHALYRALVTFIAQHTEVDPAAVTTSHIIAFGVCMREESRGEWQQFVAQVERMAFDQVPPDDAVFEHALVWVRVIREYW